jgi:hypothetical protein
MKYQISNLNLIHLNNVEFCALMNRNLSDINQMTAHLITDPILTSYLKRLHDQKEEYLRSILNARKHSLTDQIAEDNKARNGAFRLLRKAVKLASESMITDERLSGEELVILMKSYHNIDYVNYAAKSYSIANLLDQLTNSTYAPHVSKLNLDRYVGHLQATNDAFEQHHHSRASDMAITENQDTRALRLQLGDFYREVTIYVQALANATDHEQYVKTIALINGGRKYFSDMLARRRGVKASAKAKKEATLIAVD